MITRNHEFVLEIETAQKLIEVFYLTLHSQRRKIPCMKENITLWHLIQISFAVRIGNDNAFYKVFN